MEVIVREGSLLFRDISSSMITPVEGLKFSKAGVLKEHPDLKDDKEWKSKAIERLKKLLKTMPGEREKMNYVKTELIKFGYTPQFYQVSGHRPQKWKD